MKSKMGADIYESWLRKINFVEEVNSYVVLSVSTRFIRDWITSRYLDQILQIVKIYKKSLTRIEFKIIENSSNNDEESNINLLETSQMYHSLKIRTYNTIKLIPIRDLIILLPVVVIS
jgi:chromosomal replication initiator protein